jgi:hypothetical protein
VCLNMSNMVWARTTRCDSTWCAYEVADFDPSSTYELYINDSKLTMLDQVRAFLSDTAGVVFRHAADYAAIAQVLRLRLSRHTRRDNSCIVSMPSIR